MADTTQVAPKPMRRTGPLRDIRDFIPRTPQTNPNNFPPLDYRRYPLAPTDANGKHYDDEYGKMVILASREEEDAFKADHPDMREVVDPVDAANELQRLRDENAALKAHRASATPAKDDKPGSVGGFVKGAKSAPEATKQPGSRLE